MARGLVSRSKTCNSGLCGSSGNGKGEDLLMTSELEAEEDRTSQSSSVHIAGTSRLCQT